MYIPFITFLLLNKVQVSIASFFYLVNYISIDSYSKNITSNVTLIFGNNAVYKLFSSLHFSVFLIIPNWYIFFKTPSCFRKRTTSPFFTSCSLSDHFGWCISLDIWSIDQFSNQAFNVSSLSWRTNIGLLVTSSGVVELLLLFRPRHNIFGVTRARFSRSPVMYPIASGGWLIEF